MQRKFDWWHCGNKYPVGNMMTQNYQKLAILMSLVMIEGWFYLYFLYSEGGQFYAHLLNFTSLLIPKTFSLRFVAQTNCLHAIFN